MKVFLITLLAMPIFSCVDLTACYAFDANRYKCVGKEAYRISVEGGLIENPLGMSWGVRYVDLKHKTIGHRELSSRARFDAYADYLYVITSYENIQEGIGGSPTIYRLTQDGKTGKVELTMYYTWNNTFGVSECSQVPDIY